MGVDVSFVRACGFSVQVNMFSDTEMSEYI